MGFFDVDISAGSGEHDDALDALAALIGIRVYSNRVLPPATSKISYNRLGFVQAWLRCSKVERKDSRASAPIARPALLKTLLHALHFFV
jgi:hypothetical protein